MEFILKDGSKEFRDMVYNIFSPSFFFKDININDLYKVRFEPNANLIYVSDLVGYDKNNKCICSRALNQRVCLELIELFSESNLG